MRNAKLWVQTKGKKISHLDVLLALLDHAVLSLSLDESFPHLLVTRPETAVHDVFYDSGAFALPQERVCACRQRVLRRSWVNGRCKSLPGP